MPLRQRGFVQDQLIRPARHRLAIPFAILRADFEGAPIDIVAVFLRHRLVVFLDPPLHLGEQCVGQRLVRGHRRFEITVFFRQIVQHLAVRHLRVAGVAQPGIIVGQGDAMMGEAVRTAGGNGRLGKIGHSVSIYDRVVLIGLAALA